MRDLFYKMGILNTYYLANDNVLCGTHWICRKESLIYICLIEEVFKLYGQGKQQWFNLGREGSIISTYEDT